MPQEKKFKVFAVSDSGIVKDHEFTYSVGTKSEAGDFELSYTPTGSTKMIIDNGGYITQKTGESTRITIAGMDSILGNGTITINGKTTNITSGSPSYFDVESNGTGTYEVVVSIEVTRSSDTRAFTVEKYFTVYVVGAIVDADLDPSVTSR